MSFVSFLGNAGDSLNHHRGAAFSTKDVHCSIKAAGGTTGANTQTSMVCTSRVNPLMKECAGTSGKKTVNPSRGPR